MKDKVRIRIGLDGEDTWGEYQALKALNETINNLWLLSDTDWYLNRAFGLGGKESEQIDRTIAKEELIELAEKLATVRGILINRLLDSGLGNFEEFERAILKSVWENDEGKNGIYNIEKSRTKKEYQKALRDAEHLKEYYSKRYGKDISLDE